MQSLPVIAVGPQYRPAGLQGPQPGPGSGEQQKVPHDALTHALLLSTISWAECNPMHCRMLQQRPAQEGRTQGAPMSSSARPRAQSPGPLLALMPSSMEKRRQLQQCSPGPRCNQALYGCSHLQVSPPAA